MGGLDDLLVGQSAPMREIKRLIELAAPSSTTVLVQGETGTGKELVAARCIIYLAERESWYQSIVQQFPLICWRVSCLAMKKGPLQVQKRPELAALRYLVVLYFWTRLAICHLRCRPNCYAH